MVATDRLRRRCRRLLWAYPAWYRRERGLELLTTLLDAAGPGQRWPALADVVDVVRGGLRCRLQPPRGPHLLIIAAVVAVFAAVAGSSVAAMATAAAYTAPPTEEEAVAVSGIAMGQPPRNVAGPAVPCNPVCPYVWVADGDQVVTFDEPFDENYGVDHVTVIYWTSIDEISSIVSQAQTRLAANGWSVDGVTSLGDGAEAFTATRGELSAHLVARKERIGPTVSLRVERGLPAVVVVAGIAGLFGGLLIGWMLAAWTLQRHRLHHPVVRAASIVWMVPTLVVMFWIEAYTANYLLAVILGGADVPLALVPLLPAFAVSWILASVVGAVIGVIMLVNLLLAALPTRSKVVVVAQAASGSSS